MVDLDNDKRLAIARRMLLNSMSRKGGTAGVSIPALGPPRACTAGDEADLDNCDTPPKRHSTCKIIKRHN